MSLGRVAALATGGTAALCVPYWLRGARLTGLMELDGGANGGRAAAAAVAITGAHYALRLLARARFLPWRNTCLYRSVAECLVLRHYGIPCRLRIGVQNSQPPGGAIAAHAWVVRADRAAAPASLATLARSSIVTIGLLADGALALEVERDLLPLIESWLPQELSDCLPVTTKSARIALRAGAPGRLGQGVGRPTFALGSVTGWVDEAKQTVLLHGTAAGCTGVVRLGERRAELRAPAAERDGTAADLCSMLTLASALLLGRSGRALVHAAAAVAPDGGAWLLVGDARSGKSTSCASLVTLGWDYLSDDQLVLSGSEGSLVAEGWLRPFHLDEGWANGRATGLRRTTLPGSLGPGRWRRTARVAGLLLPQVEPGQPTHLTPLSPAEALAGLVRQSPWLLADRVAATSVLGILRGAAGHPAYRLHLGLDAYRERERLGACLRESAGAS